MRRSSGHFWRANPVAQVRGQDHQLQRLGVPGAMRITAAALTEPCVGCGDDDDLGDPGQRSERELDLSRRQVLAAADDDVLGAVRDRQDPCSSSTPMSPVRYQPSSSKRDVLRRIGVPEAQVGTARQDLAGSAHRDIGIVVVDEADLDTGEGDRPCDAGAPPDRRSSIRASKGCSVDPYGDDGRRATQRARRAAIGTGAPPRPTCASTPRAGEKSG